MAYDYEQTKEVFKTQWFSIEEIPCQEPDSLPYYSFVTADSVGILALTRSKDVILVRQWRPPIREFNLEFPSGYIGEGETHEHAVERELLEETGYACESLTYLGGLRLFPSRMDYTVHLYFGSDAVLTDVPPVEEIELVLMPVASLRECIVSGTINHATAVALYSRVKLKGLL